MTLTESHQKLINIKYESNVSNSCCFPLLIYVVLCHWQIVQSFRGRVEHVTMFERLVRSFSPSICVQRSKWQYLDMR